MNTIRNVMHGQSESSIAGRILDDHAGQVVHVMIAGRVYHVSVAGDALSARCLETDHYVRGKNRADSLEAMARRLAQHVAETDDARPSHAG